MFGFDHYIGMGDSISIDDYAGGPGRGAVSLLYRNLDEDFPAWRSRDLTTLNPTTRLYNLATDGATTRHLLEKQLPSAPRHLTGRVLVTITAGGNDILQALCSGGWKEDLAEEVFNRLRCAVERVLERYEEVTVVVGTVYDPTDGTGDLDGILPPATVAVPTVALSSLQHLNDLIRTLPVLISSPLSSGAGGSGKGRGVLIADIHRHFLGHGTHHADPTHPHYYPDDPTCWYIYGIEPNGRGAHEVRRLFWEALAVAGFVPGDGR